MMKICKVATAQTGCDVEEFSKFPVKYLETKLRSLFIFNKNLS